MLSLSQNDLLVTLQDFSEIACLDGRLFGVKTLTDACTLSLNACLRNQALESLIASNRRAESDLGYNLTPRYHVGIIELKGPGDKTSFRLNTDWPGIAAVNVKPEITVVKEGVEVSPYVGKALITDGGNGYCIATVSKTIAENPAKITLRDDDGKLFRTHPIDGYPKRVGSDWLLALNPSDESVPCLTHNQLNVQHTQLVKVDILSSTACEDCHGDPDPTAQILPVYPGTTDFIPMAKPVETVGSFRRYWFYVWNLVDPAFADEEVDLSHGEFWKLLPVIDFVCVREVAAEPEVYCQDASYIPDSCATPPVASKYAVTIGDAVRGSLDFKADADPCSKCATNTFTLRVQYYYKTDPAVMGYSLDLPNIANAIAYRAAAELPSGMCGCEIKTGFIAEAQKAQADARINPVTGETIFVVKFGHTYGHYVYAEKIASAPKYDPLREL